MESSTRKVGARVTLLLAKFLKVGAFGNEMSFLVASESEAFFGLIVSVLVILVVVSVMHHY